MATDEEIQKEIDKIREKLSKDRWDIEGMIGYAIKKGIQMERERPNKYKVFYDHIKTHLKSNQEVICKICGKSAKAIWEDFK